MNKPEDLIAQMKARRGGFLLPEWELMARLDPQYVEKYDELYDVVLGKERTVPTKYKELIAIVALAARGEEEGVEAHIKRGVRNGATVKEIVEALEVGVIATGTPTFFYGLKVLAKLVQNGDLKV
jgi:AhpD family alkylhydroperoxidase